MTSRAAVALGALAVASILAWSVAGSPPAAGAGVVAFVRGSVVVSRADGSTASAELGMRLQGGDVVDVRNEGAAAVYLWGGRVVRVPAGERLTVPASLKPATTAQRERPLSRAAMQISEAGLWVLDDETGKILVQGMRGDGDPEVAAAKLLSPRNEIVVSLAPVFLAKGGARPAKIAIASGKEIVWHSSPLEGDGPWPIESARLKAGALHLWRLESASDGTPLSEWTPFRVADAAAAERTEAFEQELRSLGSTPEDAAVADLLRCGHYLEVQSWTPLLGAADRLLQTDPASQVALRAREWALRGLRLDAEGVSALEQRLR